jgi:hypothetical protein
VEKKTGAGFTCAGWLFGRNRLACFVVDVQRTNLERKAAVSRSGFCPWPNLRWPESVKQKGLGH